MLENVKNERVKIMKFHYKYNLTINIRLNNSNNV